MATAVKTRYQRGQWAENLALDFLKKKGLKLRNRNFSGPRGEIDFIMQDKDIIAFIEVRYRANDNYLTALESIDLKKCMRIISTAEYYIQFHRKIAGKQCRFDVVTISGPEDRPEIGWIKNAFQA
jgi:putative endonuclease